MVDLETNIALAPMTFVIEKDKNTLYELHHVNEEIFHDYINDK